MKRFLNKRAPCTAVHLSSLTALFGPHDGLHKAHRVGDGSADERHSRRGCPVHVSADALSGAAHQRLIPTLRKYKKRHKKTQGGR